MLAGWSRWKRLGFLPWPGEIGDQPAFLVQAFELIENVIEDLTARQRRKAEQHAAMIEEKRRREAGGKR